MWQVSFKLTARFCWLNLATLLMQTGSARGDCLFLQRFLFRSAQYSFFPVTADSAIYRLPRKIENAAASAAEESEFCSPWPCWACWYCYSWHYYQQARQGHGEQNSLFSAALFTCLPNIHITNFSPILSLKQWHHENLSWQLSLLSGQFQSLSNHELAFESPSVQGIVIKGLWNNIKTLICSAEPVNMWR